MSTSSRTTRAPLALLSETACWTSFASWSKALDGAPVTSGPRFETPAEIRLLATFADVVGMTVAGEAVAASEAGLAYAAVCIVDNLANGVGDGHLTLEEFEAGKRANHAMLVSTLAGAIPDLAR